MKIEQLLALTVALSLTALAQGNSQITTMTVEPAAPAPKVAGEGAQTAKSAPLLVAHNASAADVRTGYDHSIDFARYQTYSWSTLQTGDSSSDQRIKAAVDFQMAERGWNLLPSGGSSALAAIATVRNHPTQRFFNDLGGFREQGFPYPLQYDYRTETLVINMFDASSGKLIWHGSASARLSGAQDRNTLALLKGVREMFHRFPRVARSR